MEIVVKAHTEGYMMKNNEAGKVLFIREKRNEYISTPIIEQQLIFLMEDLCDLMNWEMVDDVWVIFSYMVEEDPGLVNQILMELDNAEYHHLLEQWVS